MKKVALTSLLAALVATGANAAAKNVLDGNPLYMPAKGHFVSETTVGSHSHEDHDWSLGERFGWGITDRFSIGLATSVTERQFFENFAWNEIGLDAAYRVLGEGAFKLDLVGGYEVTPMRAFHNSMLDKDLTTYFWTAGTRFGYVAKDWTLMARANFIYANSRSFNWAYDDEMNQNHILNLGFAGHWQFSDNWSGVASADYYKVLDSYFAAGNSGEWELTAGVNFNFDATKYLGVYITKELNHSAAGTWELEDGFGFGARFGIDF